MTYWAPFEDMRRLHQEMDSAFGNFGDSKKGKCQTKKLRLDRQR